ncbi:MAG: hypothetical protein ACRDQZ_22500, partial [Mycobacteriales bacterium]
MIEAPGSAGDYAKPGRGKHCNPRARVPAGIILTAPAALVGAVSGYRNGRKEARLRTLEARTAVRPAVVSASDRRRQIAKTAALAGAAVAGGAGGVVLTGRAEKPMRRAGEAAAAVLQLKTGAPLFGEMSDDTKSYMRSMGPKDIRNGMVAATKATAANREAMPRADFSMWPKVSEV